MPAINSIIQCILYFRYLIKYILFCAFEVRRYDLIGSYLFSALFLFVSAGATESQDDRHIGYIVSFSRISIYVK